MNVKIGPYIISRRTEYSKIHVYNATTKEDISEIDLKMAEKILDDYYKQSLHPDHYYYINHNTLFNVKYAFIDEDIRYLFVPEGVTEIDGDAFSESNIILANLPNSLQMIGNGAFLGCKYLTDIELPDSVISTGISVFKDCPELKTAKLSSGLERIEASLFYDCNALEEVYLPDSISVIEPWAFCGCKSLKKINLPKNLKTIGKLAFQECKKLPAIVFPENLEEIKKEAFYMCESLKEVILPDTVTTLESMAFSTCKKLEYAKLSNKITELPYGLFEDCPELKSVVLPDSITTCQSGAFNNTSKLSVINLPRDLKIMNMPPFANNNIKTLIINHDVKELEKGLSNIDLLHNSSIRKLVIAKSVKTISPTAFSVNGTKITEIEYLGTEEEFEKFRENNKELAKVLPNIQKITFKEKTIENPSVVKNER